ncbi:MAG TPA: MoxR family ATPase [Actinomycetota bacterium]|nr:MoxR family ATPase [Actinomycetota bacterium]
MTRELTFQSPDQVASALQRAGYLADQATVTVAYLAARLGKPLLIEGPAGTGKTELARAIAEGTGTQLIRLQCYEGLDETKVLYEWNYRMQLLRLQADHEAEDWGRLEEDIFSAPFLLERPVLRAIKAVEPVVLLVDEVDRIEMETEALLLEVLSDFQVTIPELGTVVAEVRPFTVLTSNATRELSEALKRRCLYLWLDYPTLERERAIVLTKVPGIEEHLADEVVRVVRNLRHMDLRKAPSIAETLDWARALGELGIATLDGEAMRRTLSILLKHRSDIDRAEQQVAGEVR